MPSEELSREGEAARARETPSARPWWLGAAVIALGLVCLYGGYQLPQGARHAGIGPGLFVTAVGAALVILGLLLTVQIARGETFEAQDAEDASGSEKADPAAFVTALAAACVPALTIETLGLPLTAMLSFALVARSFGSRRIGLDLVSGAVLGTLAWLLFSRLGLQLGDFLPVAGI
ncbi:tripartite tricarboxylate transporter TctB family protein [Pseudochelatococcus lubricantis]|uniref:tripartite tricarboxylate transporter TctB family protein n=1 Tax=Pseudochelatococcus lubricantis TaxID=1538102 RepID=UPI0035E933F1